MFVCFKDIYRSRKNHTMTSFIAIHAYLCSCIFNIKMKIMRNLYVLLALVIALVSCEQSNKYEIKGTVSDPAFEGTTVFLQEAMEREAVNLDSAVVKNGQFKITGEAESVKMLMIALDPEKGQDAPSPLIVIEPGKINVNFGETITVGGTKLNDAYNKFNKSQEEVNAKMRTVLGEFQKSSQDGILTPDREKELRDEYEKLYESMSEETVDFIKSNIDNGLGQFFFIALAGNYDFDVQKEILASADESFKSQDEVKSIIEKIESAEKVAIGKEFIDFTMKDPNGNDISLSDYAGKGKVVLIDFWAAWCGPCRQEMPNVVEAYSKFKNKGFEVIGVSLDRTHEEWTQGLKDLNMTWPQMSDMKFWETPVVELYAFRGIPHTVLLDGEGIIIDKNLRGEELHNKLSELLDN